ncbi:MULTISPECIES: tryptophan-rich sensory protein [unclassified Nocardioides]|uniref:tryptophan-rich sensory protein n=1 Tax=unclassified Nocardioides TaxID=2615069 RepID=UPI0018863BCC|nr:MULTISPECIES: tryptophan-rich sensory protein [unclassified Nocardioides]
MAPTRTDRVRQLVVVLAEVFCVVGTLVGTGVIGTPVAETAGGALSADATLVAPAGTAFSIWSVIYVGLAAYTIWQLLPGNATDARARATGWLAAASMVLNATWLLITQADLVWLSVAVIVVLLAVLFELVRRLARHRAEGWVDRLAVDATFGLYLGWVAVATCANAAAAVGDSRWDVSSADTIAVVGTIALLALLTTLEVGFFWRYGARWAVALASAWGLAWVAVGRTAETPESLPTAAAAGVCAVVLLLAAAVLPSGPRERSGGGRRVRTGTSMSAAR